MLAQRPKCISRNPLNNGRFAKGAVSGQPKFVFGPGGAGFGRRQKCLFGARGERNMDPAVLDDPPYAAAREGGDPGD